MSKKMSLNFNTSISNIKSFGKNSSFDYGVLKIAYTGLNRNNSFISKDAFENSLESFDNVPIVTNYIADKEDIDGNLGDFGGHDLHLEINEDNDGNKTMELVADTEPVGVVPESAKKWFEIFEEDGEVREYICTEVLLWKRQKAYKKIAEKRKISHSMEIEVVDGSFDSDKGYFNIRKFELNALTLLGSDVEPCFEGSCLSVFSQDKFMMQYQNMLSDLKQYNENLNRDRGEIVEEIKDVVDEVVDTQLEPVEEVFQEAVQEVQDEIVEAVEETIETQDYEVVEEVIEAQEETIEVVEEVIEVVEDFEAIKNEYETTIAMLNQELEELREFKTNRLAEIRKEKETELFEQYSCLDENEEYQELKANSSKYETIEELEREIALIYARTQLKKLSSKKFAKEDNTIKILVQDNSEALEEKAYGGLFDRYL